MKRDYFVISKFYKKTMTSSPVLPQHVNGGRVNGSLSGSSNGSNGSGHPLTGPLAVNVTHAEVWEKNKKYIVYKVDVSCGDKTWYIYRRYNEFSKLQELMKKQVPGFSLKLPGKKLWGNNFGTEFIRSRKQGLNDFMQKILSDQKLISNPEVLAFLHLDRNAELPMEQDMAAFQEDEIMHTMDILSSTPLGTPTGTPGAERKDSDEKAVDLGPSEKESAKPNDFEFLKVIGKGSFGKVLLAKHKTEAKTYAVKVLQKKMILKRNEKTHIMCERNVLLKNLNHPFLVGLHYSFQSRDKLYFVLDYVNGGELFFHLQKDRHFSENRARFYAAEITSALGYLHSEHIVYRDLKPENILLDSDGHIVLTDFGLCKDGLRERDTTTTFCGTPEYLAPEVLRKEAYDRSVDWWCLGAVLYEMLYGLPPFYSRDTAEMYDNILHKPVKLRTNISLAARSILEGLLQKDKRKRLGCHDDAEEIKRHEFFKPIIWADLESKNIPTPFDPNVSGCLDLKNIDPEFTREPVPPSVGRSVGLNSVGSGAQNFEGFSYAGVYNMNP